MTSPDSSRQALSDPLPRLYSCFCQKNFTTYPGIYLHLKSKHANIFQKYKKLKITKLFRKRKNLAGSQIYKLENLSDKQTSNNIFYQKNIKQSKNKCHLNHNKSEIQICPLPTATIQHSSNFDQLLSSHEPSKYKVQLNYSQNHREQYIDRFSNPFQFNPYMGYPYPPHPHSFPVGLHPSLNFGFKHDTIYKLLQIYLFQSQQKLNQKIQLKTTLYNLMIFLDKCYEMINDPRAKDRIFLSYCHQFDQRFIGPQLKDYMFFLRNRIIDSSDESDKDYRKQYMRLVKFANWLKDNQILNIEVQPLPHLPSEEPQNQNVVKLHQCCTCNNSLKQKQKQNDGDKQINCKQIIISKPSDTIAPNDEQSNEPRDND